MTKAPFQVPAFHEARVAALLARLHSRADSEDPLAKRRVEAREAELGRRLGAAERYALYGDAPLSISREVGQFYYLLAVSHRPSTIVEFGSSHGISTIYLAAGLKDNGAGALITTEILADKAEVARENLREAGLDSLVDVRTGDALATLRDLPDSISMIVLDGRNDQYTVVLELLRPRLVVGGLVVADLGVDDPDLIAYQAYIRRPESGFFSVELPLDAGLELSVRLGR